MTAGTKKYALKRVGCIFNIMVGSALIISVATSRLDAQEFSSRAGFDLGGQITFSTPYNNTEQMASFSGYAIYAEKIWESNNAIRGRLQFMTTKTFITKHYNWMGSELLVEDKVSYQGAVVEYLRYFDKKYVPYVFVGLGIFKPEQKDKGGHYSGSLGTQPSGSGALYYGAGWDVVVWGKRIAMEFDVRNGSEAGQTFEASLSFSFNEIK